MTESTLVYFFLLDILLHINLLFSRGIFFPVREEGRTVKSMNAKERKSSDQLLIP